MKKKEERKEWEKTSLREEETGQRRIWERRERYGDTEGKEGEEKKQRVIEDEIERRWDWPKKATREGEEEKEKSKQRRESKKT